MTAPREFAVPKEKQPVSVHLIGGEIREGSIFLEYYPDARSLHHKMLALLEDKKDFFPLSSGSGIPDFINKHAIRLVEVQFPEEENSFEIMHVELVTIIFQDGAQVSGDLLADVPSERARLSDSLNLSGGYLCTRVYGKVCYVNKKAVQRVLSAGK
jgi:hypothetical protein